MKRREFLESSTLLGGALLGLTARAAPRPCPPPTLGVSGGGSTTTPCTLGSEQDWIARSRGPGVVWAHDFRYPSELTNFLWIYGDKRDSGVAPRIVADGPTGNCLEYVALGATTTSSLGISDTTLQIDDPTYWPAGDFYFHLAGPEGNGYPGNPNNLFYCPPNGRNGTTLSGLTYVSSVAGSQPFATARKAWPAGSIAGHECIQVWNRPFAAFASPGNGLPVDDLGTGVTRRVWTPVATGGSSAQYYGYGYYGHPTYQAAYPSWTPQSFPGSFVGSPRVGPWDGDEFYVQFAVKIDRRFWDHHKPSNDMDTTWQHKLMFIQTQQTVPHQLVPFLSPNNRYMIPSTRTAPFQWYTTQAGRLLTETTNGSGSYQPGSQWASSAQAATSYQAAGSAWEWYDDEWLTVQIRVKPGLHWDREANPNATGVRNTLLEVQIARQGEPYTTVYSQSNQALTYGSSANRQGEYIDALPGFCAIIPTLYLNVGLGVTPPKRSYYHRFTQFIFSKQPIAAPKPVA